MPKIINKVRKKIKRKEKESLSFFFFYFFFFFLRTKKESLLEDEKKCNFNGLATLGP